jgi:broad specificity phosphatase PhoE
MKRLIIVRHGECADNIEDRLPFPHSPLTKKGVHQAKGAANRLKKEQLKTTDIIASPLVRTFDTARIISDITSLTVVPEWRLKEMDFGKATGCSHRDFETRYPEFARKISESYDLSYRWPKGESRLELYNRVKEFCGDYLFNKNGVETLIVSHWVTIGFLCSQLIYQNINYWDKFLISNGEIISLSYKEQKWVLDPPLSGSKEI